MENMVDEKFVVEVEKYQFLYDPQEALYHNRVKRRKAWESIADACGVRGMETACEKRWRYLRDRYVKERRKVNSCKMSGATASYISMWHLFPHLKFLDKFIKSRCTQSNLSSLTDTTKDLTQSGDTVENLCLDLVPVEAANDEDCLSPNAQLLESSSTSPQKRDEFPPKKKKRPRTTDCDAVTFCKNCDVFRNLCRTTNGTASCVHTSDDDELFLFSLLPYVKKIPKEQQLNFRTELMQCVSKWLEKNS